MTSKLHMYSFGYVVEDKEEDSNFIKVYPVELFPNLDGDLDPNKPQENITTTDVFGNNTNTVVDKTTIITARWLPLTSTNRMTAPSVCAGETVMLFRYGDTDRYYWVNMYNEIDLRKREKFTIAWSNKDTVEDKSKLNQMYYLTVDTINKKVIFHTDDGDGELTTYDITIDTKEGVLTVYDGRENMVELDSSKDKLTVNINNEIEYNTTDRIANMKGNDIINVDGNKNTNVKGRYDMVVGNFTISNNSDEWVALMAEFIQAIIDIQHVGNLGIPTSIEGGSKSKLEDIKARTLKFAN